MKLYLENCNCGPYGACFPPSNVCECRKGFKLSEYGGCEPISILEVKIYENSALDEELSGFFVSVCIYAVYFSDIFVEFL